MSGMSRYTESNIKVGGISKYAKTRSPEYHAYQRMKRSYNKTRYNPSKFYKKLLIKY